MSKLLALALLPFFAAVASASTRIADVVYMKSGGVAFTMDVLKPAKPNKAAVIFIVSGGWYSDDEMLKRYDPDIEKTFADAGFTVFEVVHGAQPRFTVAEIVEQVRAAVRFVHEHATDYGIDTNRVGVTGISTGGHLALMIAGSADSPVNAVAAIAPPTDLVNWGKPGTLLTDDPQMAIFVPALGMDPKGPRKDMESIARSVSPIVCASAKFPPTLLIHGDEDKIVPLQQSQAMDRALDEAGAEHELDVVAGCGHDPKLFDRGLKKALEWFKGKLAK